MNHLADPWTLPLETLDPSHGELFENSWHHEYFRRLRKEDPVHWSPTGPSGGYWSITKFQDIIEIEKNHKVFSSDKFIVVGDQPEEFNPPMFIAKDPPVHDIQRKAAAPAVAPPQLAELEAKVRQRTAKVLDSLPIDEEFDWVEKVSIELTTLFLAALFDFPLEDRYLLTKWSDASTATPVVGSSSLDQEERQKILMECLAYFQKLWAERAMAPAQFDFISLMAHNPNTADMVDEPLEFLGNLMLLIVGGNDTSRNSMSAGVALLNQFPDEYKKLRSDPSLIPNMVSEIIRYQTPLAHMRRTATEDIEFGGKLEVIENPDTFLIDRKRARHHLSFGFGIHRCMGNRAAEMQIRILWEEIMKRFKNIEVQTEPKRVESNFVMGIEKLLVKVKAL